MTEDDSGIVTTIEEIEGYNVVKAILRDMVDAKRIVMRDQKSFCAVLLDDNNRKNICRLWFNSKEKQVGIIDASGQRVRRSVGTIDDIFGLSEHLRERLSALLASGLKAHCIEDETAQSPRLSTVRELTSAADSNPPSRHSASPCAILSAREKF